LSQGGAAIIAGHLFVRKNLETAGFQQVNRLSQQQAISKYAAA
jgi:hypothetical protein